MRLRISDRLILGVGLAIAVLLAFAYSSYRSYQQQLKLEWTVHSNVKSLKLSYDIESRLNSRSIASETIDLAGQLVKTSRVSQDQFLLAKEIHQILKGGKQPLELGSVLAKVDEFQLVLDQDIENTLVEIERYRSKGLLLQYVRLALSVAFLIGMTGMIIRAFRRRKLIAKELEQTIGRLTSTNEQSNRLNTELKIIAELNDVLQSGSDVVELAVNTLERIVHLLKFPAGVFYYFHPERQVLIPVHAIGLEKNEIPEFLLGDGLGGKAASSLRVEVIDCLPDDYYRIKGGLGEAKPKNVVFVPLVIDQKLIGMMELASFTAIDEELLTLFEIMAHPIAVNAARVWSNQRLEETLSEVQTQADALRASEEELRVHEEELRQLNTELSAQNDALEENRHALAAHAERLATGTKYKSEFLANMSHELRTPLNSILILAKLLSENKSGALSKKDIEFSELIYKSGSDLLKLINDILDLSKIEAGKMDFVVEQVDVKSLLEELRELFLPVADTKQIQFAVQIEEPVSHELKSDHQRIGQILKNLVGNAFKFTPPGGSVNIVFKQNIRNGTFIFEVKDTGVGIQKDKQAAIFEAFQQADGSVNRKYGGTGLGLSISTELARKLNGEITLKSELGNGSVFSLVLKKGSEDEFSNETSPKANVNTEEKNSITIPSYVPAQTQVQDDRFRLDMLRRSVLIVEDDINFANILKEFAASKGYQTIVTVSGDEALYCAKIYRPSAIILDRNLPIYRGDDIIAVLKKDEELAKIPVHIISSEDAYNFPKEQVVGYALKPLILEQMNEVFDVLNEHIDKNNHLILLTYQQDSEAFEQLKRFMFERERDRFTISKADALSGDLKLDSFGCILFYLQADVDQSIESLTYIQQHKNESTPVFVYLANVISEQEEQRLRRYCATMIQHSEASEQRLLDELELFLSSHHTPSKKTEPAEISGTPSEIADTFSDNEVDTILLADDDMRNVFALSALLEANGFEVLTAINGRDAIDILKSRGTAVQLALIDIMMPEMDGYETIRQIREEERFRTLPVIALTAKAMPEDRQRCIAAGASDYISKPVKNEELINAIKKWIAK